MKTKNELRQDYRQLRKQLSGDEVNDLSRKITTQLGTWLEGQEGLTHFHLFFPISKFILGCVGIIVAGCEGGN